MKRTILCLSIIAMIILCSGAASATKTSRYGNEIKLYTDSGVYKNHIVLPGLFDYEFKNNVVYTVTPTEFATFNVKNPSVPIRTYMHRGTYYDIDMISGSTSGTIILATNIGMSQYTIKSSDNWLKPVLKFDYNLGFITKSIDVSSSGVKVYAITGDKYQFVWRSDGYLIPTDAWF